MSEELVREAGTDDFPEIADLFAYNNFGPRKEEWLRWKYLQNPDGQGRIFVMEDAEDYIKGTIGFLPRRLVHNSQESVIVMHTVDVFLAPEIRGKKLYPKFFQYSANNVQFPLIGFPNERAEQVNLLCGCKVLAPEERWEFPCVLGNRSSKSPGFVKTWANAASKVYALVWLGRGCNSIEMRTVSRFQTDFPCGYNKMAGIRTADYLNWRFIDNPMRNYYCHEFYDGAKSIGYSVYGLDGSSGEIFDFVVIDRPRICLQLLVKHCREAGLTHLLFRGTGLELGRYGFIKRRGSGNYISYHLPKNQYAITLCDSDW